MSSRGGDGVEVIDFQDWQVGGAVASSRPARLHRRSEAYATQQNLQQRDRPRPLVSMTDDAMNNDAIATVNILLQRCGPCHFLAMHP